MTCLNHQSNANQDDNEILLYTYYNGHYKKKTNNSKYWRRCREIITIIYCCWECKIMQPLQKIIWSVLKILKIELPSAPAIPLRGIYPEKLKSVYSHVHFSIFTIAKMQKQHKCPSVDEWKTKCGIYYIQWNIIHPIKIRKSYRMQHYRWIRRTFKWNKLVIERQIGFYSTYMWFLKEMNS